MKKTILIGLMAAMMLFAFTACENNAPATELTNPVVRLYQDNEVEYLVNEVPAAEDFVIMGQRADGSVFQISADDISLSSVSTGAAGDDQTVAKATYDLGVYADPISLTATVYAVEKVEAEYNGASFDQYYAGYTSTEPEDGRLANDVFHKSQYTVTVTYDTDQTRTLAADEYLVTTIADTAVTEKATATIALDLNKDGKQDDAASEDAKTATVDDLVIVSDPLESLSIALAEKADGTVREFYAGKEAGTAVPADFEVTGHYTSGKEIVETKATVAYDTTTLTDNTDFPASGSFTVKATVGTVTATQSFAVTQNYIKSFEVKVAASLPAGAIVDAEASNVSWASGSAPEGVTTYTVISSPSSMPVTAVPGNSYAFTFSLQGYPEAGTVVKLIQCAQSVTTPDESTDNQ